MDRKMGFGWTDGSSSVVVYSLTKYFICVSYNICSQQLQHKNGFSMVMFRLSQHLVKVRENWWPWLGIETDRAGGLMCFLY